VKEKKITMIILVTASEEIIVPKLKSRKVVSSIILNTINFISPDLILRKV